MTSIESLLDRFEDPLPAVLEVPEKWHPRLVQLDAELKEIVPGYVLHQVKVKFGDLRFYAEYPEGTDAHTANTADELIYTAEEDCAQVVL